MNGFLQSASGRVITLSLSLALVGGGAGAVLGGVTGLAVLSLGLMAGIAASVVGVALGVERFTGTVALYALLAPWVLFLFGIGTLMSFYYQPSVGYLFIAMGIAALTRAIFVGEKSEAPEHSAQEEAHAH